MQAITMRDTTPTKPKICKDQRERDAKRCPALFLPMRSGGEIKPSAAVCLICAHFLALGLYAVSWKFWELSEIFFQVVRNA